MPVSADQPGWRPDPERPGQLRWWNGLGWSDARRAADDAADRVRAAAADAARGSTLTPQDVARTTADRARSVVVPSAAVGTAATNAPAAAAVGLGAVGLLGGFGGVLPVVALLVSLGALIRARRLARDGARRTGLAQSLVGLALSLAGLVRWLPLLVSAVGGAVDQLLR